MPNQPHKIHPYFKPMQSQAHNSLSAGLASQDSLYTGTGIISSLVFPFTFAHIPDPLTDTFNLGLNALKLTNI